jgi:hypothetical protein
LRDKLNKVAGHFEEPIVKTSKPTTVKVEPTTGKYEYAKAA